VSNHFSADNLRFPGDDTRLDLTDLFAFRSENPGRTVLIIDSNPTVRPPIELPATVITSRDFHPGAVYRINIDNDGDAQADVAFTFTFSEPVNGVQTGTVHYATGAQAREPGPAGEELTASVPVSVDAMVQPVEAGEIRVFAGARSEPFFADIEGALHGFQWTGHDDLAGNNVLSIVLVVPDDMLGGGPVIGAWATIRCGPPPLRATAASSGGGGGRTYAGVTRTWITPAPSGASRWKAAGVRSMHRPGTKGPRSLMRTTTEWPFPLTLSLVPKGTGALCAAVRAFRLNGSPLAVIIPVASKKDA
jgi:hypothetical protein